MGNHSSRTEEDEEIDLNPNQIIHPQSSNQTTLTSKLLFFFIFFFFFFLPISIYKITKYLLQKLWRKREKTDPLLPPRNSIQNIRHYYPQTRRVKISIPGRKYPLPTEEGKGKRGVEEIPPPATGPDVKSIPGISYPLSTEDEAPTVTSEIMQSIPGVTDPLLPTPNPIPNITHLYLQIGWVEISIPGRTYPLPTEEGKGKRGVEEIPPPATGRDVKSLPRISYPLSTEDEAPKVTGISPQMVPESQTGRVVKSTPGVSYPLPTEDEAQKVAVISPQMVPESQTAQVVKSIPGVSYPLSNKEGKGKEVVVPTVTRHSPRTVPAETVVDVDCTPELETGRVMKPIPGLTYPISSDNNTGVKSSRKKGKKTETVAVLDIERRIKHYSNRQRILVVGDGDFSFSASLAVFFGSASNMIATSMDSKRFLKRNYAKAQSNMKELKERGGKVMNQIDATVMANHELLWQLKFDRIVYNFPYAGFFRNMSRANELGLHRNLVEQFLKNAKQLLSESGEIHISHKANGFHNEWNIKSLAKKRGLKLVEAVKFSCDDYPGYQPKYGFDGGKNFVCDKNFDCDPSRTYKFGHKGVRC